MMMKDAIEDVGIDTIMMKIILVEGVKMHQIVNMLQIVTVDVQGIKLNSMQLVIINSMELELMIITLTTNSNNISKHYEGQIHKLTPNGIEIITV